MKLEDYDPNAIDVVDRRGPENQPSAVDRFLTFISNGWIQDQLRHQRESEEAAVNREKWKNRPRQQSTQDPAWKAEVDKAFRNTKVKIYKENR